MALFSLFPTEHWANYWAKYNAQQTAIVWKKGAKELSAEIPSHISWQQWHRLILQAVIFLRNFANLTSSTFVQNKIIAYSGSSRLLSLLCYIAAIAAGYKILILNPALSDKQRNQILADNQIEIFITEQHFSDFFAKHSKKTTACHDITLDFQPERPATLTLTSGSSGKPKAIVHSIKNHLSNAEGVCDFMQFTAKHCWLLSLPLFHVSGQGIVWRWLLKGATLMVVEDKDDFLPALAEVSHASLVPTQLQRYLQSYKPHCKQHFLLGGSSIPVNLIRQAQQFQIETYAGYGMTEMASTICAAKGDLDNVGWPLRGREVQIVNTEIWVKGDCLALGYWQNNTIISLTNAQGWLATKDCGYWNSSKKLVVQGRLDNMFISGGENIQPEEIEKTLYQSDLLEQVFVLPINDNEFGQRPIAFIKFKETLKQNNFTQSVDKLQNWLTNKLEKFKHPVRYFPLDTEKYQQQSSIKISRNQLKTELADLLKQDT